MTDENIKLLQNFSKIIQELMLPSNHNLTVKEFLLSLDFDDDNKKMHGLVDPHTESNHSTTRQCDISNG